VRGSEPQPGIHSAATCRAFSSCPPFSRVFLIRFTSCRRSCELLEKLDLTVNFIDVDALEESIEHLVPLLHLRELFLMGNPCAEWPPHRDYVIALLPQLCSLDGKEVTRAERLSARQRFRAYESELRGLAASKRAAKGLPAAVAAASQADAAESDGAEPWSPEARVAMYRELAEQKEEKERQRRELEPPKRDYAAEHAAAVEAARAKQEASGVLRQCNEGRWDFSLEDEDGKGNAVLRLQLSRFLDTSLVDVDLHPTHVTVIIRSKVFRILWPAEVISGKATCQRSQTTGELVITAPKSVKNPVLEGIRKREGATGPAETATAAATRARDAARTTSLHVAAKPRRIADELLQMQQQAIAASGSAAGVKPRDTSLLHIGKGTHYSASDAALLPRDSTASSAAMSSASAADDGHDDVPPLE
jgi:protein TilB